MFCFIKKISQILDFYFSCNEILAYDLAISLNAWGFKNGKFIKENFKLLQGYQTKRRLKKPEKKIKYLTKRCIDEVFIN